MAVARVDFLPPDYRERRSRRRIWIMRGSVTVALALGMVFASVNVTKRSARLDAELTRIKQRYEQARIRIAQVEQLDRQKEELSRRLGILRDVVVRARGSLVLEAVGSSCPESARLTKVDLRVNTTGPAPEVDVTIEGRCPDHLDVANLLSCLSEKPLLSNVRMVLSENVDALGADKKFVITAKSPGLLSDELLRGVR
jgi:Tfp pilus assembly protein PilN